MVFNQDYEHLGRVITEITADKLGFGAMDSEKSGSHVTNYSKDRASQIIDGLVAQA